MQTFAVNDRVIFHQAETSTRPVRGAHDVSPAERGELYSYVIGLYWRVVRVNGDGTIDAIDRNGQITRVRAADPRLEKVRWWNRWTYRRFLAGL